MYNVIDGATMLSCYIYKTATIFVVVCFLLYLILSFIIMAHIKIMRTGFLLWCVCVYFVYCIRLHRATTLCTESTSLTIIIRFLRLHTFFSFFFILYINTRTYLHTFIMYRKKIIYYNYMYLYIKYNPV